MSTEQNRSLEQAHETMRVQGQTIENLRQQLDQDKQKIEKQKRQIDQEKERLSKRDQKIEKLKRQIDHDKERTSLRDERIAQLQKKLASMLEGTSTDGIALPPFILRPCGCAFNDDEVYLARADKDADKLARYLGLSLDSSLLDVGSGPGRIAIGILRRIGEIRKYRGVDVDKDATYWGQQNLAPKHPNFQFAHIDVKNKRYNPDGSEADDSFTFPFADGEFDIVILYSVFTHMLEDGVRGYLKEFQRLLRPDGKIYLTAFVEEGVPDVEENPEGYQNRQWKRALHCVLYNREFFEKLLDENGFRLDGFDNFGAGAGNLNKRGYPEYGQRGVFISKKTGSPIIVE